MLFGEEGFQALKALVRVLLVTKGSEELVLAHPLRVVSIMASSQYTVTH